MFGEMDIYIIISKKRIDMCVCWEWMCGIFVLCGISVVVGMEGIRRCRLCLILLKIGRGPIYRRSSA